MKHASFTAAVLFVLALAACQQQSDTNLAIDDGSNLAGADIEMLPPSDEAGPAVNTNAGANEGAPEGAPDGAAVIPAQYHGRWSMVPADCTSTRGDAKGLITIGDRTVRFYESLATLKERRPATGTSFSALFGFTGEGQTWEKVMTFTRTGDDTLRRADDEGSYTYRRCA